MDWQIVVTIILSIGAVVAFFAMGEDPEVLKPLPERKRQSVEPHSTGADTPTRSAPPVPQTAPADSAIVDRFIAALRAANERGRDGI